LPLQLKAIGSNFAFFVVNQDESSAAFVVFVAYHFRIGVFALLFGTRKVEVTE